MPTTVHIPDPLLKSVDRRANALGISRNRLVIRALKGAVSVRSGWAPEFLQRLRHGSRHERGRRRIARRCETGATLEGTAELPELARTRPMQPGDVVILHEPRLVQ